VRTIIVGAGQVGSHLAEELSKEGRDIAVIEFDPLLAQKLSQSLDLLVVTGDGSLPSSLEKAGIKECDHFIAVTNDDRVNMMSCILADEYNVETKVAKVDNKEYANNQNFIKRFKINRMFNGHELVLNYIHRLIEAPDSTGGADFADGQIVLRGIQVLPDTLAEGMALKSLGQLKDSQGFMILAVVREDHIVLPRGDDIIQAGDTVYILTTPNRLGHAVALFTPEHKYAGKIVIYGANQTGIALAERLEKRRSIILIDKDETRLEEASKRLRKTLLLESSTDGFGDLWENEIERAGIFVSVRNSDEDNMMACLIARQLGADKVIPLIQLPDYISAASSAGIKTVINPKLLAVGEILRYIRQGKVLSVVKLEHNQAEVMEVQIDENLDVAGKAVKDLAVPVHTLVGAVFRKGKALIARGDTVLLPGDRVMICSLSDSIHAAEEFFSRPK